MGGNVKIGSESASRISHKDRQELSRDIMRMTTELWKMYFEYDYEEMFNSTIRIENFFSGTSHYYIDIHNTTDSFIESYIHSIGDIDFMVDVLKRKNIEKLLVKCQSIDFDNLKLIGFKQSPNQTITLWKWNDKNIQIDFEYVEFYDGCPTEFSRFTYSSSSSDLLQGLKGCFHKFLIRALTGLSLEERKVKNKRGKVVVKYDNMLAFSNNGLRRKYSIDDFGFYTELKTIESCFETDISSIFNTLFKNKMSRLEVSWYDDCFSFIGLLKLIKQYYSLDEKDRILDCYFYFITKKGARIVDNDLSNDLKLKQKSLQLLVDKLQLNVTDEMSDYLNKIIL